MFKGWLLLSNYHSPNSSPFLFKKPNISNSWIVFRSYSQTIRKFNFDIIFSSLHKNEKWNVVFGHNVNLEVPLHKKMKFFIKDFFSKCDQIRSFLRIWSHLLKKSLMENFIFCAVYGPKTLQHLLRNNLTFSTSILDIAAIKIVFG